MQQARTFSYNLHRVSGVLRLRRAGGGLWYAIPYHTILLVGCDVGGEKRDVVVRENLIYEESMVLK